VSLALTIVLYVVGVMLALLGLVGLVLPGVPGAPLIYLGIVGIAWADGFERIGPAGLLTTALIALAISIIDYTAGIIGARRFGASYWGLLGAFLGLLAGIPLGLPGLIVGPIVGAILLEYLKEPDFKRAGKVGAGTLLGFVVGTAVKYALALRIGRISYEIGPASDKRRFVNQFLRLARTSNPRTLPQCRGFQTANDSPRRTAGAILPVR